ncbi:prolyl oligopeptidase family serine peptidase [Chloroflexi bacterium TSY]|nr:prolyl oligopeptidase family serine peptidase [Chloroflexi bacterium TSY]
MNTEYQVESNIIYGMVSGTALLGDLYRPSHPNGIGLLHISGSGWHAPTTYDAHPLNSSGHVDIYVKPLAARGFTIFTINHRAAPTFTYPAALHDAQRAIRFFRYNADDYGFRSAYMGAMGGSSGGHLVSLVGVLSEQSTSNADDPVERMDASVQCVVARAPATDLVRLAQNERVVSFMGKSIDATLEAHACYQEASPLIHVSEKSPPFMLIHGTADSVVPLEQSLLMENALKAKGVPIRLIEVEGAEHGPHLPGAINKPDLISEISNWFEQHLG